MNALMKLAGFSTSNKVKNHCTRTYQTVMSYLISQTHLTSLDLNNLLLNRSSAFILIVRPTPFKT